MTPNSINPSTFLTQPFTSKTTWITFINGVSTGRWSLTNLNVKHYGSREKRRRLYLSTILDGQPLECVPYVKDLGVTVCCDMSWSRHIEETVAKANRTLGLVKRTCKDTHDQRVRKLLFCALVRPILEYASSLWSPYTIKHERTSRKCPAEGNKVYSWLSTGPNVCRQTREDQDSPSWVQKRLSQTYAYFLNLELEQLLLMWNKYICTFEPGYQSRNYDKNNYNLIIKHKQDYFRNSFFIRTVELWNTLPSHVKSSNSLSIFKSHLHKLYSTKLSHYVPPGTAWSASTHCDLLNHHPAIFIIFTNML